VVETGHPSRALQSTSASIERQRVDMSEAPTRTFNQSPAPWNGGTTGQKMCNRRDFLAYAGDCDRGMAAAPYL
jgi:hypothetical protein